MLLLFPWNYKAQKLCNFNDLRQGSLPETTLKPKKNKKKYGTETEALFTKTFIKSAIITKQFKICNNKLNL